MKPPPPKTQKNPHPTIISPIISPMSTEVEVFLPAVTLGLVTFRETDDSTSTSGKQKGSKISRVTQWTKTTALIRHQAEANKDEHKEFYKKQKIHLKDTPEDGAVLSAGSLSSDDCRDATETRDTAIYTAKVTLSRKPKRRLKIHKEFLFSYH